jgi:hypothetical protein
MALSDIQLNFENLYVLKYIAKSSAYRPGKGSLIKTAFRYFAEGGFPTGPIEFFGRFKLELGCMISPDFAIDVGAS